MGEMVDLVWAAVQRAWDPENEEHPAEDDGYDGVRDALSEIGHMPETDDEIDLVLAYALGCPLSSAEEYERRRASYRAAVGELGERAIVPSDLWMQTYSGLAFRPAAPHVAQIALIDIAHGLANTARYSGQTQRRYSVAEHSVHLARWCLQQGLREEARIALLHDAAEAYLCDIPRPLKVLIAPLYKPIEARVEAVIAQRFGLASLSHPAVKAADDRILEDERRVLMVAPPLPWTPREPLGIRISPRATAGEPWPWEDAFLELADTLGIVEVNVTEALDALREVPHA